MNISIVHPSRGRAILAHQTATKWIASATNPEAIQYVLSIDRDDPQKPIYLANFKDFHNHTIIQSLNKNVVDAMNSGARAATGDLIVCISDDFEPFIGWDAALINAIDKEEQALQVSDGITNKPDSSYVVKFGHMELIMTIPILTKKLYDRLGYIYYPAFSGMFADNDLAEACNSIGCLKQMPQIEFTHKHYTNGHAPYDATYARHNTALSWKIGESLIKKRRAEGFNLQQAL
jgi:glycosyltransferase involved in cell wall biosynthesis